MLQTFSVYVHDRPGVLNRVASLFRRYGFNIESLSVGQCERPGISVMTLVIDGEPGRTNQIEANLRKLLDVVVAERVNDAGTIARELVLIKVRGTSDFCLPRKLIEQFQLRVVDQGAESVVLEATAIPAEIDKLVRTFRPGRILELVRAGKVVMARAMQ